MTQIVIFGGAFDPPHLAHRRLIDLVQSNAGAVDFICVPSYNPPHKEIVGAEFNHRVAMLDVAFGEMDSVQVSSIEESLSGKTYTHLLLERFRDRYPSADLSLCLGGDSLKNFCSWKHWDRILELVNLLVVVRGVNFASASELIPEEFSSSQRERVRVIPAEPVEISSTLIRSRLEYLMPRVNNVRELLSDEKLSVWLSPGVIEYIYINQLYT